MNVKSLLSFETKRYLKTSLYFTIVWVALIFLFMSFYDVIQQNSAQLTQLYATFPKELMSAFGKSLDSLNSINGYFGGQIVTYLILSGCIFSIFMASNSLAGEVSNRNILFLLSKPISRLKIYYAKFVAVAFSLLVSNVVLLIASILSVKLLTHETNIDLGFFCLAFIALFLLELFFAGFAEVIGARFNNGRAIALGSLAVIVSYLLNVLSGLSESAQALRYLSPVYYLDITAIVNDHALKPESLIVIILGIIFVAAGGYFFKKKDIN